jgi:hypothetical protein
MKWRCLDTHLKHVTIIEKQILLNIVSRETYMNVP